MKRIACNFGLLAGAIALVATCCELIKTVQVPAPLDFALGFALACSATGVVMALWEEA